jgi:hypothetical protein
MPAIDLSILNQRQTPAFYADILANRPSAGFVGRIFVSTDTFAFYRDNGTTWDLIGGPGTGTVTGTGANGQVTYWNGASTITGSNDLFWDNVNGHLGIGTNVPGTALQIDHDQNQFIRLNQTTATNDTKIAFQNSGVALWRIGNSYNAGANDFGIYDVVGAIQPVTVKKTTGQVLIGTSTVGSGKLVVASSTGDNGVQIVGAAAPSLRIDNAESGPTKRAGLGISTAANNFIQGSVDRDFCIFNGSTTASPILFGIYDTTNVAEAARISAARNFLIGTTTDGGQKLQVSGSARATSYFLDGMIAGSGALYYSAGTNRVTLANYNASGILLFEVNGGNAALTLNSDTSATFVNSVTALNLNAVSTNPYLLLNDTSGVTAGAITFQNNGVQKFNLATQGTTNDIGLYNNGGTNSFNFYIKYSTGNFLIGTTTDNGAKFQVSGSTTISSNVSIGSTIQTDKLYIVNASGTNTVLTLQQDGTGDIIRVNGNSGVNRLAVSYLGVTTITNLAGTGSRAVLADANGVLSAPVSDISIKENIKSIGYGLNEILKMKPVWFDFIDGYKNYGEGRQNGNIAQEMEEIIPEAVFLTPSTNKKGINYDQLDAVYIKAIQELNAKIENLK